MKYWVFVRLTLEDIVEADSKEEAIDIISEQAVAGGNWECYCEEEEEDETNE